MIIWNNNTFSWNYWENYNETKNDYQLSSWTWTKIVYAKFRDAAWNESPIYSDNIDYIQQFSYLNFNSIDTTYTNNSSVTFPTFLIVISI